jgi:hypothetical protein
MDPSNEFSSAAMVTLLLAGHHTVEVWHFPSLSLGGVKILPGILMFMCTFLHCHSSYSLPFCSQFEVFKTAWSPMQGKDKLYNP